MLFFSSNDYLIIGQSSSSDGSSPCGRSWMESMARIFNG